MDMNALCVSHDRICLSLDFLGSFGNVNVHYLVDLVVPPFGSPTTIVGLLDVVCSWGSLGLI